MPRLTIAVCTWNRAALLPRCLDSIARSLRESSVAAEVIVVNNNCTDDTDGVLRRFEDRLPLRRVFEPTPGLSNARNAALAHASGDYVLWTDDDVAAEPAWVGSYCAAFEEFPEAAIFGGPIHAEFEGERPSWIAAAWPSVRTAFAECDLGEDQGLGGDRLPFGANFAVRRAAMPPRAFDPGLGRTPANYWRGGEELALFTSLLAQGHSGRWISKAHVRHWIPKARQTTSYLWNYYSAEGALDAVSSPPPLPRARALLGAPLWFWRVAAESAVDYAIARVLRPPARWVPALTRAAMHSGRLKQHRKR